MIIGRKNLTGWLKARILIITDLINIIKFLWEDFIYWHRVFAKFVSDGNPENKVWIIDLAKLYNIKHVMISAYNLRVNGMVEAGYKLIINTLSKLTKGGYGNWVSLLPLVLWVERTCVRASMGRILYKLLYNYIYMLPVEVYILTWNMLPWH